MPCPVWQFGDGPELSNYLLRETQSVGIFEVGHTHPSPESLRRCSWCIHQIDRQVRVKKLAHVDADSEER
jgi:hypothetical protein